MLKKLMSLKTVVPVLAVAALSAPAFAAPIDTASMNAGITEAQTAILAVIGALIALSVAIFGVTKVYSFISKKAGA